MNKYIKYSLWTVGGLVAVAGAAVAYIAATFNPNDYKPYVIQAVKDSTQRNLRLDGDIKLAFYPNIGANVSRVSLSEFRSEKPFASVESVRVSLALMPLLRKQVVVRELNVSGLSAALIKHRDGTSNIDDLLKKEEAKKPGQPKPAGKPVEFDISSVSLTKTNLSYHDEGSGAQYAIKDLELQTGAIKAGVPGSLKLSMGLQSNQPKLDLKTQIKTGLMLDLAGQKYQVQGLDLQATGSALDFSNLKLKVAGDVDANLGADAFAVKNFSFNANGLKGQDRFDTTLEAPGLTLANGKYSLNEIVLNATMNGSSGDLSAHLLMPGGQGDMQAFTLSALTVDVDLKQPQQAFKVKVSSPVAGNLKTRQFNLSNVSMAVSATGDKLPNKSVSSEMKGTVYLDALKEVVQANLAGGLLQSKAKLQVGLYGFKQPAIRFDAELDQFDADLYRPNAGKAEKTKAGAPADAGKPEQPLDLSALRTLKLDGSLRVGALKAANLKLGQLRADVAARDGVLNVNPLSANLYQGSTRLRVGVNAAGTAPRFAIAGNLAGVQIAPLLKDLADLEIAEGKGNIALDLDTQGNKVSSLKKALAGKLSIDLADGAIRGINLPKVVQSVQSLGKGQGIDTFGVDKSEKTPFSEFKASFNVANGVAYNNDLAIKSALLRVTGSGAIDVGQDRLDYTTKVAVSKSETGSALTVPVHLTGPFDALKYRVDYGAVAKDVIKEKAQAKIESKKEELKSKQEELKSKAQEQLQNQFRKLFK